MSVTRSVTSTCLTYLLCVYDSSSYAVAAPRLSTKSRESRELVLEFDLLGPLALGRRGFWDTAWETLDRFGNQGALEASVFLALVSKTKSWMLATAFSDMLEEPVM